MMNIWYFCLDPNISIHTHHRAPTIHIQETISSLQALGHEVGHFLYGDQLRPWEQRLRRPAQTQTQPEAKQPSAQARRPKEVQGSPNSWLGHLKPLLRDAYQLYQNALLDRSLIEPVFAQNRIDLVYERLSHSKSSVSACAQKRDIPFIVESNSTVVELREFWGSPLWPLVGRVEIETVRRADAVIVVSTPLKRYYEGQGIPSDKIAVMPNGVNESCFTPDRVSRNLRAELGLEDKTVVGFVGNVRAYHGVELLVSLARMLDLARHNIQFLVVGDGMGMEDLLKTLNQDDLAGYFTFTGTVPHDEVPEYIAAMDICLMPRSNRQGSPMKLLEYGAMGKAMVAPNLGPIQDIFCHGDTAYLFEPENVPEMAAAVSALADDVHLRTSMGAAARRHILAHHTWRKNAERITEIYHQITL